MPRLFSFSLFFLLAAPLAAQPSTTPDITHAEDLEPLNSAADPESTHGEHADNDYEHVDDHDVSEDASSQEAASQTQTPRTYGQVIYQSLTDHPDARTLHRVDNRLQFESPPTEPKKEKRIRLRRNWPYRGFQRLAARARRQNEFRPPEPDAWTQGPVTPYDRQSGTTWNGAYYPNW